MFGPSATNFSFCAGATIVKTIFPKVNTAYSLCGLWMRKIHIILHTYLNMSQCRMKMSTLMFAEIIIVALSRALQIYLLEHIVVWNEYAHTYVHGKFYLIGGSPRSTQCTQR